MVALKPAPNEKLMETILSQIMHEYNTHLDSLERCEHGHPQPCDDPDCVICRLSEFQLESKAYKRMTELIIHSVTMGVLEGEVSIINSSKLLAGMAFYAGYITGRLQATAEQTNVG